MAQKIDDFSLKEEEKTTIKFIGEYYTGRGLCQHLPNGTRRWRQITGFKVKTSKLIFRGLENHFNWYILPDTCFQNTDVSFLNLLSPDHQQSGNSNGLYIIKKKRIN